MFELTLNLPDILQVKMQVTLPGQSGQVPGG